MIKETTKPNRGSFYKNLKFGDFLVVAVVLVLCAGLWANLVMGFNESASACEIVAGGVVVLKYDLDSQDKIYEISNLGEYLDDFEEYTDSKGDTVLVMSRNAIHFDFVISEGKIKFNESTCPDRVCVYTGFVHRSGELAACIPANILVRIVREAQTDDPDLIIG